MATLKIVGFWSAILCILACSMYLSVPAAAVGSHIHFTSPEGEVVKIQSSECDGPGHICWDLHHDCEGEVVRIVVW